ncbi:hypothetical protein [Parasporobacterium paucivorans]|uniref:ABC-2 family transporter protein n=1 Tax=Parasporobacterium paucivorans DSM 15970 TaxID=1122934 RepID=A0A1M6LNY2_9FIRM|nr:hypothetical protein [Parasporobacterium paucivorans]SHJ72916.1 hypothetical protein SAMN02745691_02430 [Parasporobacterium paucivorans DSM 15970]
MLGKLFRHEFRANGRIFLALYAAFIGITLINKLFWVIETSNVITEIFRGFITVLYVVSIVAIAVLTFILIVYRFYNNLLKDEGYLSFTLPVKTSQHIIAKLLVSFIFVVFSVIIIVASLFIMGVGAGLVAKIAEFLEQVRLIFTLYSGSLRFVAEAAVLCIVAVVYLILMLYASLSVGQLFMKHKLGGAVLGFVGLYVISQIISSVLMAILFFGNEKYMEIARYGDAATPYMVLDMLNVIFLVVIIFQIVLSVAYYLVTNLILSKKLNLE